jgi:3-dehydroquinate dehydratase II
MKKILLVHGPNLNRLGRRDQSHYGTLTLATIEGRVTEEAQRMGYEVISFQSNHEGGMIDFIQAQADTAIGIIINPGAFTHYSYALHDALKDTQLPCIEVHLSDIKSREEWRRHSVVAPACVAQISGKKELGYDEALQVLHAELSK